jgi:glutamine amidotransferase
MTRIGIFDYGAGNLHSLLKAIKVGARSVSIETDIRSTLKADMVVLPGVGAFGAAAAAMRGAQGYVRSALADGKPCLGVCLGMQMLFDASEETPGAGVGLIPGRVTRLLTRKVPHMGWNEVDGRRPHYLLDDGDAGRRYYFVHSFHVVCSDPKLVVGETMYGYPFSSIVARDNIVGVQFHPEKSHRYGMALLRNFIDQPA